MSLVAVTKDNGRQTVIQDGFQNLETTRKNLPKDQWPTSVQSTRVAADGYFKPQNEASGFTNSNPASHASWLRQTTSASALRPVSGCTRRTRL